MSNTDDSRLLLQDFEPSGVRLKRRLRLILSKTIRNKQQAERKATLFEFLVYLRLFNHFYSYSVKYSD